MPDLFGHEDTVPFKTGCRKVLLALPAGTRLFYRDAYRLCVNVPGKHDMTTASWHGSLRDELHRLREGGWFTSREVPGDDDLFTRTGRGA